MQITQVKLTEKQQAQLSYAIHFDPKRSVRQRSRIILMKSEGRSSRDIAKELSISEPMVNRWVKRYLAAGFEALQNKKGQGRKPIMDASDEKSVIEAIKQERSSLMKAKERWQKATGKKACRETFRSFLSVLAQDLDV